MAAPHAAPDVSFHSRSVDLFKYATYYEFPGFPQGWTSDYCATFTADLCALTGPQVIRFVLTVDGPSVYLPTLWVDDSAVVRLSDNSVDAGKQGTEKLISFVAVLEQGCHKVSLAFYDPNRDTALVRSCDYMQAPTTCHHAVIIVPIQPLSMHVH